MTLQEELRFVKAKLKLMCNSLPSADQRRIVRQRYKDLFAELEKRGVLTKQMLRSFDSDLRDQYPVADWASIERSLLAEFGFSRLGKDPATIISRVIKRGRIRTDAEGDVIRDFVACLENEKSIGTEAFDRLMAILDKWEAQV
ncbi:MAG: hypothetical protein ACREIA_00920 [Opitutaceae bacterium]